ncbi:unnamed protein product [Porites evermanni]|uniref:Uncharacterized protein n=1 Tax=Porites evermanni TaxID=104178 RepID=A0ABN8LKH0_9CNID|nr:unnamed protein product [Porites evermanni]
MVLSVKKHRPDNLRSSKPVGKIKFYDHAKYMKNVSRLVPYDVGFSGSKFYAISYEDEVGLLVVSAGDWHGQSRSQRPRSRGPEDEIVAWHEGIAQRTGVCFSGIVPQRSQIDS